jgi:hypothetical protein
MFGCWHWIGANNGVGYGHLKYRGRWCYSHRLAYEDANGPVPPGMVLDHLCRNRACCNPDHLEAVTFRENLLRGTGRAALNAAKTHCPKGHEYSEENTRIHNGSRVCRLCMRTRLSGGRLIFHASKAGSSLCGKRGTITADPSAVSCKRCLRWLPQTNSL